MCEHLRGGRQAFTALKLVCWLNTLERKLFSGPYEARDCDAKMDYFLPRFASVLVDPVSLTLTRTLCAGQPSEPLLSLPRVVWHNNSALLAAP
jgi:hypothetical protein